MRDVPQRSIKSIPRKRMPDLSHSTFRSMVLRTRRFDGGRNGIRFTPPCARLFFGNVELAFLCHPLKNLGPALDPILAVIALRRKPPDHPLSAPCGPARDPSRT